MCVGSGPWLLSDRKTAPYTASEGVALPLISLNERTRDMAASAAAFYVARGQAHRGIHLWSLLLVAAQAFSRRVSKVRPGDGVFHTVFQHFS